MNGVVSCLPVHDLDDAWFQTQPPEGGGPVLGERGSPPACPRCGTFSDGVCEPCTVVASSAERTREAYGIAWKLAIGPSLVIVAALAMLARHRDVPPVFAIWLVPLACAYVVARTERAGWAWIGTLSSIGVLLWLGASVAYADQTSRLIDVLMLSIAPTVAVPGCVRLLRLSSSPTR